MRAEADAKLKRPRMEEIVLVRHGESEGNLAFNRSVAGDHSLYADEFLERHSSFWRLTDQGREQALITGKWMRDNIDTNFDSFFSSEYLRAMETAALLDLPGAKWKPEVMLRERDWGEYDLASQLERRVAFRRYEGRRRRESLFWAPPGGESLAQVVQRVDSVLLFGNRRFSGGRVIMTCHGELMWAFRLRFERLTQLKYREMQADPQVHERIHNCQVLQYTRRCPESQVLYPDFQFMRSVCPWATELSSAEWKPIPRSGGLTNLEVLDSVERYPRLLNDGDGNPAVQVPGHPEQGLSCSGDAMSSVALLGRAAAGTGQASGSALKTAAARGGAALKKATDQALRVLLLTKTARYRLLGKEGDGGAEDGGSDGVGGAPGVGGTPGVGGAPVVGGDGRAAQREARYEMLQLACATHERAVKSIADAMRQSNFELRSQDARAAVPDEDLAWADVVFALGGDGTMLRAAQVAPAGKLCIGVNTDPQRSVGKICSVSVGPTDPTADALALVAKLAGGGYEDERLPLLRVTVEAPAVSDAGAAGRAAAAPLAASSGASVGVPTPPPPPRVKSVIWAVNECFVGESDPSRPLDLEISVDDGPWSLWRSSGVLVATQLGSGAWLRNACSVSEEQAKAILQAASGSGVVSSSSASGAAATSSNPLEPWSQEQLAAVTTAANAALLQHDEQQALQYLVREPAARAGGMAGVGSASSADGQSTVAPHSLGRRVRVRPTGWNMVASIDGLPPMRLPNGCVLSLEIEPDNERWLRTIKESRL